MLVTTDVFHLNDFNRHLRSDSREHRRIRDKDLLLEGDAPQAILADRGERFDRS